MQLTLKLTYYISYIVMLWKLRYGSNESCTLRRRFLSPQNQIYSMIIKKTYNIRGSKTVVMALLSVHWCISKKLNIRYISTCYPRKYALHAQISQKSHRVCSVLPTTFLSSPSLSFLLRNNLLLNSKRFCQIVPTSKILSLLVTKSGFDTLTTFLWRDSSQQEGQESFSF